MKHLSLGVLYISILLLAVSCACLGSGPGSGGPASPGPLAGEWPPVTVWPGEQWNRVEPEAVGMDSALLAQFVEAVVAERLPVHGRAGRAARIGGAGCCLPAVRPQ